MLYELFEGHWYDTVAADSAEEALQTAIANVDRRNYDDIEETTWIDVRARGADDPWDEARATVTLDPDEPRCSGDAHDWQSPYELVGGCKENPGVWGNGGGVIIREACMNCGCARITNTWAQRQDNGEQGLTSVRYEENAYEIAAETEDA